MFDLNIVADFIASVYRFGGNAVVVMFIIMLICAYRCAKSNDGGGW